MLLRSRVPPPYSSFRSSAETLAEGPIIRDLSKRISEGSMEERKDGIATLAFLMDQGKILPGDAVEMLGRALSDPDAGVRKLSFLNLVRLGKGGLEGMFLGVSGKDNALRIMSLERIYTILGRERNLLRCSGEKDVFSIGPKIEVLISVLENRDPLVRHKATSCLRELALRSPLIVMDFIERAKDGVHHDTELFYRLSVIESSASDALAMSCQKARC